MVVVLLPKPWDINRLSCWSRAPSLPGFLMGQAALVSLEVNRPQTLQDFGHHLAMTTQLEGTNAQLLWQGCSSAWEQTALHEFSRWPWCSHGVSQSEKQRWFGKQACCQQSHIPWSREEEKEQLALLFSQLLFIYDGSEATLTNADSKLSCQELFRQFSCWFSSSLQRK